MESSVTPQTIAEIEDALSHVADIRAARVVASPEGLIQEIHVLALPTKSSKQIARDVESTIMAAFGIAIDHKVISIAQLGQDSLPKPDGNNAARARIKSIQAEVTGVRVTMSVTLELEGDVFTGHSMGPNSQTERRRLVAMATLDALGRYANSVMGLALEDVQIVKLGGEKVAVSCVTLVTPLGEQAFSGSALVRQNEKDSVVRATLDAINRRMGFLTTS